MRGVSYQSDTSLCMTSAIGVVVRMGVNMGVDNSRPTDNMQMGKESRACVETHKEHYEKERDYFLRFDHIKYGPKV